MANVLLEIPDVLDSICRENAKVEGVSKRAYIVNLINSGLSLVSKRNSDIAIEEIKLMQQGLKLRIMELEESKKFLVYEGEEPQKRLRKLV